MFSTLLISLAVFVFAAAAVYTMGVNRGEDDASPVQMPAGDAVGTPEPKDAFVVHRDLQERAAAQEELALAWSADGARLATGGRDGCVRLWDARSGRAVWEAEVGGGAAIRALDISPGGDRIAYGTAGTVGVLAGDSGEAVADFSELGLRRAAAHAPERDRLAAGVAEGAGVAVVRAGSDEIDKRLDFDGAGVSHLEFSEDGRHLVVGAEDTVVRVLKIGVGRAVHAWFNPVHAFGAGASDARTDSGAIAAVGFGRSAEEIVVAGSAHQHGAQDGSAGSEEVGGMLQIIDMAAERVQGRWSIPGRLCDFAVTPDAEHLTYPVVEAVGGDTLETVELESGRRHASRRIDGGAGAVTALAYRPEFEQLAAGRGDGRVYRWQADASGAFGEEAAGAEPTGAVQGAGAAKRAEGRFSLDVVPWQSCHAGVVSPPLFKLYGVHARMQAVREAPRRLGRRVGARLACVRRRIGEMEGQLEEVSVSASDTAVDAESVGLDTSADSITNLQEKREALEETISTGIGGRAQEVQALSEALKTLRNEERALKRLAPQLPPFALYALRRSFRVAACGRVAAQLVGLTQMLEREESVSEAVLEDAAAFLERCRARFEAWSASYVDEGLEAVDALYGFVADARRAVDVPTPGAEQEGGAQLEVGDDEAAGSEDWLDAEMEIEEALEDRQRASLKQWRRVYVRVYDILVDGIRGEGGGAEDQNEAVDVEGAKAASEVPTGEESDAQDGGLVFEWERRLREGAAAEEQPLDADFVERFLEGTTFEAALPDGVDPGKLASVCRDVAQRLLGAERVAEWMDVAEDIPEIDEVLAPFAGAVGDVLDGSFADFEAHLDEAGLAVKAWRSIDRRRVQAITDTVEEVLAKHPEVTGEAELRGGFGAEEEEGGSFDLSGGSSELSGGASDFGFSDEDSELFGGESDFGFSDEDSELFGGETDFGFSGDDDGVGGPGDEGAGFGTSDPSFDSGQERGGGEYGDAGEESDATSFKVSEDDGFEEWDAF